MSPDERKRKIELLKNLQAGNLKPGEFLTHGVRFWLHTPGKEYVCDAFGYEWLKVPENEWKEFEESFGGLNIVQECGFTEDEISEIQDKGATIKQLSGKEYLEQIKEDSPQPEHQQPEVIKPAPIPEKKVKHKKPVVIELEPDEYEPDDELKKITIRMSEYTRGVWGHRFGY